jgi:hypothetical protein
MHWSFSPELPVLPVGAGARDSATDPCVGDTGDSRPVVGSIDGLAVDSDVDELDDEPDAELGTLGCTQAANSKTSTAITMPKGTILGGINVAPRRRISRPRAELQERRSRQRLALWEGRRKSGRAASPGC